MAKIALKERFVIDIIVASDDGAESNIGDFQTAANGELVYTPANGIVLGESALRSLVHMMSKISAEKDAAEDKDAQP